MNNSRVSELTRAYHLALEQEERAVNAVLRVVHNPQRLKRARDALTKRREETRAAADALKRAQAEQRRPLSKSERGMLRSYWQWQREHKQIMG